MKKPLVNSRSCLLVVAAASSVFSMLAPSFAQMHPSRAEAGGDDRATVAASAAATQPGALAAAGRSRSPQQRQRGRRSAAGVYKASIRPHWFAGNTGFWYRNDLRDGKREFVVVDAVKGVRRPAFDHKRLADALREAGVEDAQPDRLPLEALQFEPAEGAAMFRAGGSPWRCDLQKYELRRLDAGGPAAEDGLSPLPPENAPRASERTGADSELTFVNRTEGGVELFWLDTAARRRSYGKIAAGQEHRQHTYTGHVWEVVDAAGTVLAVFRAQETPARAVITGKAAKYPRRRRVEGPEERARPRDESPDGEWTAFVRDHNVFLRSKDDAEEIQLSTDGGAEEGYGMLQWAPDGVTLVAFRIAPGDRKEVHLIESSPRGGGRAILRSRPYALPGDKFSSYELNLFDMAKRKQLKPKVERIDFGRPRLRFSRDGRRFTYQKTDRGHQRYRLIEVDSHTGDVRNVIDEKTDTFIWAAHTENVRLGRVNWISNTNEIVYASERDGWRHLYLIDAEAGQIKTQITEGEYVVRAIDRIDEQQRQIWFRASGMNPGQDPYLMHFYRVNFDGSALVALTEGDGDHSVQYSPDRRYLIDTYSRVDMAPVHELRRTSDGKLICELEKADIS
ncbi:MAG: DPP IV N-terminal domain-containing protein, partial [Planctomycetota bacterium]